MKILIVCIHYPVCSGRYAKDAFRRLGHDVRSLGDSTGSAIWGGHVAERYAWQADGGYTAQWDDWKPDLIVVMDSAFAYHHPVYADVPHVVWGADNHVRDYRQPGIEHYFVMHKAVSLMAWRDDMSWLPACGDGELFMPSPIPWDERPYDVCLIGVIYEQRMIYLQSLANAGLVVHAGTGALFEDYRDIYHRSRVSLCVSAAGDLAQRVIETAQLGCSVLSDVVEDLIELDPDPQVMMYSDVDDAVAKAKKLIEAGPNEVLKWWAHQHTWDARAEKIVTWWEEKYNTPPPAPPRKQGGGKGQAGGENSGEDRDAGVVESGVRAGDPAGGEAGSPRDDRRQRVRPRAQVDQRGQGQ